MIYYRGLKFPQKEVVLLLPVSDATCASLNGHSARKSAVLIFEWCLKARGDSVQDLWRYWWPEDCIKKWYDKPTGHGCSARCMVCRRIETVTLLCLVTWPSTPTYRMKSEGSKRYDSHCLPESSLMWQIALCFVYCFLDLWTFCEAVLLLIYVVATKIWNCC